jgi:peptidoglycan/xylan/chitin deacetylase (PgdA/CDA1 family)
MRCVITFHAVDDGPPPLSYPARLLDQMLGAFNQAGIPVLSLPDLLAPGNGDGVALTFDDGMASLHDEALPILKKHGAPAHLFLTTTPVGGDNHWYGQPADSARYDMLNWGQIEALHAGGVFIEGHTANHPDLRQLDRDCIAAEMDAADSLIEQRLGRRPRYFAYPYGYYSDAVRAVARETYEASFTTELAYLRPGDSLDRLPRLDSHYLRHPALMRGLLGQPARAYMGLRHAIRAVRGRQ